ncbi:hypothetical protein BCR44DRAFT_1465295 [Catenaria anguillulae PL171]|uniref:Uncharacterized protein n=1 Tax=Catenaria anguillulae PL171 TaxID=765915 RepID=A0A1Y2H621_9FUNG|nr:hypothetical protein BCR44DRAFT_1465295 [Catenaria anguillulae PL171]
MSASPSSPGPHDRSDHRVGTHSHLTANPNLPPIDTLQAFCATDEKSRVWNPTFDSVLYHTANTGALVVEWPLLRELIKARMLHEVSGLHAQAEQQGQSLNREEINAQLHVLGGFFNSLTTAPFTVQRMCEIALTRQHTNVIKYLRQIERVVCVSSSVYDSDWIMAKRGTMGRLAWTLIPTERVPSAGYLSRQAADIFGAMPIIRQVADP